MNPTIKFSHEYPKLPMGAKRANLVHMSVVNLLAQTSHFLEYDTSFIKGVCKMNYALPKEGKYLLLCFEDADTCFFTTLRRWTPEKEKYYQRHVGDWFDVEVSP